MAEEVVLLLGSNTGRRVRSLRDGIYAISSAVRIAGVSRIYVGEPSERPDQPWFLNVALRGETDLSPDALLRLAKRVERDAGRKAAVRFGPRELDVDIILMGNRVIRKPHLEIPHPKMAVRRFCLVPVAEIAPEKRVLPGNATVAELLRDCSDSLEVTLL